jgi:hypothetical protein
MGDLERGSYPLYYGPRKLLGQKANANQGNLAVRSNLEFPGIGSLQDAAAALTSGSATLVPVPVEYGDLIQFVDVFVGATAASTPTHSWAALYNEAGTLVGTQATDGATAAIAASATFTFTLGAKYIVNSTDSPRGLLYAAISVTASTVPSLVSGTVPTACQYAYYTNAVPFYGAHSGSSLGATAASSVTLSSATTQSAVPLVVLR